MLARKWKAERECGLMRIVVIGVQLFGGEVLALVYSLFCCTFYQLVAVLLSFRTFLVVVFFFSDSVFFCLGEMMG